MVVIAGTILALYIMAFSYGPRKAFKGGDQGPGAQLNAARAGRKRGQSALVETEYNQNPPFHVAFSTSCSPFQDWQSLLVFLTADMVGQKGPLTRIASGCTLEEQAALETVYAKLDQGRNKFRLHFTPDFSKDEASGETYYFYNKPGGLQHWLASPASPPDDTVIAVIDPDFIFMRPLTAKVKADGIIFSGPIQAEDLIEEVSVGHPAAQYYGIGDKWIEFNLTYIAGEDSPALAVKSMSAWKHYSIGPPYIVAKTDMVRIAQLWHSVVPRVYEGHPHLLAEMYAYSVAAAHLELPHLRLDGYMTSEAEGYGEAWPLVDLLTDESICSEDLSLHTTLLPTFLHYCQHYKVGTEFVYWKRDLNENFFSCGGSPLPLPNLEQVREYLDPISGPALSVNDRAYHKYHTFQYCQVVMKTNKALQKYKSLFCDVDDNGEAALSIE